MFTENDVARFESRFVAGSPTECWVWNGGLQKRFDFPDEELYGVVNTEARETRFLAHRMAYILAKGPIPEGHVVRHSCDNRRCVNPNHLSTGTQKENCADGKGKPKRRAKFRLNYPDAVAIRVLWAYRSPDTTIKQWCAMVAKRFRLNASMTVYDVIRDRTHLCRPGSKRTLKKLGMAFLEPENRH